MVTEPAEELFEYKGYRIPVRLIDLTGGGTDTWDVIARGHMEAYERYAPIAADASVLEIGCGVGRDAMQLAEHLSERGRYVGIDIIAPSIEWCRANITPRHPNFSFVHLNIESQIHNPGGAAKVTEVALPVESGSVDRILLQSVFTHMFADGIVHYLKEFRRVLRPDGKVVASVFLIDADVRRRIDGASDSGNGLTFRFPRGEAAAG